MQVTTLVPPTNSPVTADDVKSNILIRTDEDDDFIERTIATMVDMAEAYAKISIMPQTKQVMIRRYELEHHPHPELYFFIYPVPGSYRCYLPRPPIVAITEVKQTAITADGSSTVTETLDTDQYYLEGEEIVINVDEIDPTVRYFTVTYDTGYVVDEHEDDVTANVPRQIKEAIIIAASDHYDNRTSFVLPVSSKTLLAPFRRQRIMSNVAHGSSGNLAGYNSYYY